MTTPSDEPTSIPIRWRRSTRARRIALRIDPSDGIVTITLPPRATQGSGMAFFQANLAWIERQRQQRRPPPRLQNGSTITLEGEILTIRHAPTARRGVWHEGDAIHVSGDAAFLPRRVLSFMHDQAARRLPGAVHHWATRMEAKPTSIALRDVRSRWGSCTRQGRIMLSWRLVMTPPAVRDYVIIHELAHLAHFDHSQRFWQRVETFCPARKRAETWLRRHGGTLLQVGNTSTGDFLPDTGVLEDAPAASLAEW